MTSIPCEITESVVKTERITEHDVHIALIETGKVPKQPYRVRYRHPKHGDFVCLGGGFAWPGIMPGMAIVVGVKREEGEYRFVTLEEVQESDIPKLILAAYDLYRRWGWNCHAVQWRWYGEPVTRFIDFLTKFNEHIPKRAPFQRRFNLVPAAHYEETAKDWWETLAKSLYAIAGKKGRLKTSLTPVLSSQLKGLTQQDVYKSRPGDFPGIAAYAYALVTMYERRPWMRIVPKPKLISAMEHKIEDAYLSEMDLGGFNVRENVEGYAGDLIPMVDAG